MKKSLVLVLVMIMVLSIALSACTPKAAPETGTPAAPVAEKQELVINFQSEPGVLDWQKCSSSGELEVWNSIMEGLTRNANGTIKPGIAEKWDVSQDGL